MANVVMKGIRKAFGSVEIIKGIDLTVDHGEFVVFVGPSGCGKSTLLRLIAGLEDITSGTMEIGGKVVNDLPPKDRSIAMVFQSYALFPHMTVYDNVAFGLNIAKAPKAEIEQKVQEAARILKMESLLQRKPSQLSGGQRQRVAIGRAIVRKPEVFLFDEPLSNLDAALRVNTRAEIAKLHRDLGATMIYVTHDQVEAMTLADKIVVLEAGIVRQVGSPLQLYHMPDNQFVAGFIGSPKMNFIPVTALSSSAKGILVNSPDFGEQTVPVQARGVMKGDKLMLGIRPEDMEAGTKGDIVMHGNVELVERLGHETFVEVQTKSGASATALISGTTMVEVGHDLALNFSTADCHLFDEAGEAFHRLRVPEIAHFKRAS
jgi:multiple sugar transport system ATP-binding protein